MDILRLTVGEKFDHTMPAEAMSIVLMNGVPMLAFLIFRLRKITLLHSYTVRHLLAYSPNRIFCSSCLRSTDFSTGPTWLLQSIWRRMKK